MTEEERIKEDERNLQLITLLARREEFQTWRDLVAKPLLAQYKGLLARSDDLPEATVRANIKVYNILEALFYTWFEDAAAQVSINKEAEKKA